MLIHIPENGLQLFFTHVKFMGLIYHFNGASEKPYGINTVEGDLQSPPPKPTNKNPNPIQPDPK